MGKQQASADRSVFYWIGYYSGLFFIFSKADPRRFSDNLPTIVIWLLGIYFGAFTIAAQRYESKVDLIEQKTNVIVNLVAANRVKFALEEIPEIQNRTIPSMPSIGNPWSIFLSYFGEKERHTESVDDLKELMVSFLSDEKADIDYKEISIVDADLSEVNLSNANLNNITLTKSDLQNSVFKSADLSGANLSESIFINSDFGGVKAEQADFGKSNLEKSTFEGAKLVKSYFIASNLQKVNFDYAVLKGADLEGANLMGARLSNTDFEDANLAGADLRKTIGLQPEQLVAAASIKGIIVDEKLGEVVETMMMLAQSPTKNSQEKQKPKTIFTFK